MDEDAAAPQQHDDAFVFWNIVRIGVGIALLVGFAYVTTWLLGTRNQASVIEAERVSPDAVNLVIASCNQRPVLVEVVRSADDIYEVTVKTEEGSNGNDCADLLELPVDPGLDEILVIDRVSGNEFRVGPAE